MRVWVYFATPSTIDYISPATKCDTLHFVYGEKKTKKQNKKLKTNKKKDKENNNNKQANLNELFLLEIYILASYDRGK